MTYRREFTPQQRLVLSIARMPPPENWVVSTGCKSTATRLARQGLVILARRRCGNVNGYDVHLTEVGQAMLDAYGALSLP